jgi:hypothetical protein
LGVVLDLDKYFLLDRHVFLGGRRRLESSGIRVKMIDVGYFTVHQMLFLSFSHLQEMKAYIMVLDLFLVQWINLYIACTVFLDVLSLPNIT